LGKEQEKKPFTGVRSMVNRESSRKLEQGPDGLPDTELEALACLWQAGSVTAREVREAMNDYRPMTHGAMVTILKRLEAKGLVTKRKGPVGKAFLYSATSKPEPMYRKIMHDLRERVFGGSGVTMVASLLETKPPTPKELEELQGLLDALKRGQQ
jgi:BlaI family penicillinase repressor